MEGILEFGFVKHRVGRPLDRAGVLIAVAGEDATGGMTALTGYLLGEIVPAADTLISEVEDALMLQIVTAFNNRKDSLGSCRTHYRAMTCGKSSGGKL